MTGSYSYNEYVMVKLEDVEDSQAPLYLGTVSGRTQRPCEIWKEVGTVVLPGGIETVS